MVKESVQGRDWKPWLAELLLGGLCGLLFLVLADRYLADIYGLAPWNSADFVDYCSGWLNMTGEEAPWPIKRARLPALLPVLASHGGGMMDSFRVGAVISTFVIGSGLYAWARILAGRTAGMLATIAALGMAPMTRLPRMLTFYPELTATIVVGAALVSAGLLNRDRRALAFAGAGIGLVLCADVRGLAWAVPWMAGALAMLWWSKHRRTSALCLFVPLALSFLVGRWSFPPEAASFEAQLDVRPLFHEVGSTAPEHLPPYDEGGAFVWGRSPPWDLPRTGLFVIEQLRLEAPPDFPPDVSHFTREARLEGLDRAWWAGAIAACVLLFRGRRRLAVLGVTVLPFALGFHAQHSMVQIYVRFLGQMLPGLAVLVGVSLGWALDHLPGPGRPGSPSNWGRVGLGSALALLLVLGVLPSPLSPYANWRRPWPHVGELDRVAPGARSENLDPAAAACAAALSREQEDGHWIPSGPGRPRR